MINKIVHFPYCGDSDVYMLVKHVINNGEGILLIGPYLRFDSEGTLYINAVSDEIIIKDYDNIQVQEYSTLKELALDFINRNLK